ncbi:virion core cysteine protease [Eastern grey kangaroopox virus]|uniref:Virion core cysteine protease n=1 Tax=Eastern grey kangaroopox virus TaxID=2042482 RepID=A0A2C9DT23_9POXV|nr:virion core cysteine protease [Eastern grey kangaroopox virus]ATI21156.1 virion core cysteine protease [Eastern grey kangaroopox virus]ATX75064.1 virion core cysteine protease [Eastern grey kangaroopox virus]
MDRYTDLVINKIPELGFVNLLSHIYTIVGLSANIDVSKFANNCNGYVVERLDRSETAGKVSCIPLALLSELVTAGHLQEPPERLLRGPELELKTFLVGELRALGSFEDICRLPTSIPLAYFFKPRLRERVSRAVDFSQMDLRCDDLSRLGVRAGENDKVVRLPVKPERSAWMSNSSIQQLLAPMAHGTDVAYLGQFNLNFLNTAAVHEKAYSFNANMLVYILKEKVRLAEQRHVMFGFCYRSHWKSVIFDKQERRVAFYDSGGSNPADFHHYRNFFFFSFSDGFNLNTARAELSDENADVDTLFRFFVDNFDARQGCINTEINQLMESECGMFISLFMTLCALRPPCGFKELRRVYTYFRFLADKKMTMLKTVLFAVDQPCVEVRRAESEGLSEYRRMELWSRRSVNVLAEKITRRINKFLEPPEH